MIIYIPFLRTIFPAEVVVSNYCFVKFDKIIRLCLNRDVSENTVYLLANVMLIKYFMQKSDRVLKRRITLKKR